jgi:AhpD family alkylhydroperoxidase
MLKRANYGEVAPAAMRAMYGLENYLKSCGLESSLLELVKLRASQINGCAYCIDMHSKDARAKGESEQRLYGLAAWQETHYYTPRERAALLWAEAVTLVATSRVPDEIYLEASQYFSELELVNLTMAMVAINGWNRLCISFREEAGTYQPAPLKISERSVLAHTN